MATTDNGYPAAKDLPLRALVVSGIAFAPGIADNDDVETVLRYCMEQYVARVEPLKAPGCWGFAYRENRNDPNSLSRHSGGIAIDANAPAHPNGVPTANTFTAAQIAECHAILAEVDHAVRWGGDYRTTPDAMHWEIDTDPAHLHEVAEHIREHDDMNATQDERLKAVESDVVTVKQAVDRLEDTTATILAAVRKKGENSWQRDVDLKALIKECLAELKADETP